MCVAKILIVSRNVSLRLFHEKQKCDPKETFREAATFFTCFAVLRHRNQPFSRRPLFGGVKLTAASVFATISRKVQYFTVLQNISQYV
jgi:hypothetical protein